MDIPDNIRFKSRLNIPRTRNQLYVSTWSDKREVYMQLSSIVQNRHYLPGTCPTMNVRGTLTCKDRARANKHSLTPMPRNTLPLKKMTPLRLMSAHISCNRAPMHALHLEWTHML